MTNPIYEHVITLLEQGATSWNDVRSEIILILSHRSHM